MAKKQEQENAADMLRQFDTLKQKHPDAMLLFRKGDFYEMYREGCGQGRRRTGHHADQQGLSR